MCDATRLQQTNSTVRGIARANRPHLLGQKTHPPSPAKPHVAGACPRVDPRRCQSANSRLLGQTTAALRHPNLPAEYQLPPTHRSRCSARLLPWSRRPATRPQSAHSPSAIPLSPGSEPWVKPPASPRRPTTSAMLRHPNETLAPHPQSSIDLETFEKSIATAGDFWTGLPAEAACSTRRNTPPIPSAGLKPRPQAMVTPCLLRLSTWDPWAQLPRQATFRPQTIGGRIPKQFGRGC